MRDILRNPLFFGLVLLFISSQTAFGQLLIKPPAFVLSGVKAEFTVEGAGSNNDRPVHYKAVVDGQTIDSGVALPEDIKTLKLSIPANGMKEIFLTVGEQTASARVRSIPGWFSLLPPVIAIVLALITREVITSLFIGIWVGATFVFAYNPFFGFLRALDKYILGSLADTAHSAIVIFSLCLGGMIGIINRTGGMQGIVEAISRRVKGPRTAQIATWAMGVMIFFDDYANTLIVGNSMRPVTDNNKISREKLAYLVDSTAAPVAGIAVLSTWIGYEIGLIREAYVSLGIAETN
ncbi:MAG: Na+/H+ antiporter NhaC family protein, partial [Candidatus Riflebacteria bacterium]|nr:Na+/H+ antiporter NhaC family protein [Candidatus Riflebacteria bacterium]